MKGHDVGERNLLVSGEYQKVEIGNGTFYVGDCIDVMRDLPDGSVDMVLTDIPYNEVNRKSSGLRNLNKGVADSADFDMVLLADEVSRLTIGSFYGFCGFKQSSDLASLIELGGMSIRVGAWNKTNPSPMNGTRTWLSALELCVYGRKPKATFNGELYT